MICDTCVYKDNCDKKSAAECQEAADEARREAMRLDDNEDSLKWRFTH